MRETNVQKHWECTIKYVEVQYFWYVQKESKTIMASYVYLQPFLLWLLSILFTNKESTRLSGNRENYEKLGYYT